MLPTLTTKALTEYITTQTKVMSYICKKKWPEFQWETPLQGFPRHRSCTKRIEKGDIVQTKLLSEQENKANNGKAFCSQMHRYICAQPTWLLLFKFSLEVFETERIEEGPVLWYCNR